MKIYLAGPDVFKKNHESIFKKLKDTCNINKCIGLCPFDNSESELSDLDKDKPYSEVIFRKNVDLIKKADIVIANLTPFRGPSTDSGTVWEIGYAHGLGKPVFGYTEDSRKYKDKVQNSKMNEDVLTDENNDFIEDFDLIDNLMIVYSLKSISDSFLNVFKEPTFKQIFNKMNKKERIWKR